MHNNIFKRMKGNGNIYQH